MCKSNYLKFNNLNKNHIKQKNYIFDLEGVICNTKKNFHGSFKLIKKFILKINQLRLNSHKLIIFIDKFTTSSVVQK